MNAMAIHDWTRVEAGIFHDFHHAWIEEIKRALNRGLLPPDYYAMAEQQAAGFGPDVLTLQETKATSVADSGPGALLLAPPKVRFSAESAREFYRRKAGTIVVRHISGDRMIAVVEVISPGNKSGKNAFRALIEKACELLEYKIHLLLLDLFPPSKRDPHGLHAALWDEITGEDFTPPVDKPLTLAAYESGLTVKCYVEPVAVGDALPDMPLFLEPGAHVLIPLEKTYDAAYADLPARWRRVLDGQPS